MIVTVVRGAIAFLFGEEIIRWAIYLFVGLFAFSLIEGAAAVHAIFGQPFGQWYMAGMEGASGTIVSGNLPPGAPITIIGSEHRVSDVERFQLARAAGFNPFESILATAMSIAEDGSGDPAALSPANRDGSRDLGLWQINSGWWPQFGGLAALIDPLNNARAAYVIYKRQGWCAWSTFEASCGPGHTGSYSAFLTRARIASEQH